MQRARAGSSARRRARSRRRRAAELGGEGGQPVGLVAADVPDPAQVRRRVGESGEGRDRRGQLAGVVQVEVDPARGAGPVTLSPASSRATSAPIAREDVAQRVTGLGGRPASPRTVTCPPVAAASARNGAAFDRSGSIGRSRAAPGPGRPASGSASVSSTSTPGRAASARSSRCAAATAPACRRGARRRPRRTGRREEQRRDELAGRGGVDDHCAAADAPGAGDDERQGAASSRRRDPERAQGLEHLAIGRVRACGSPSKATRAVGQPGDGRHEPHDGAGQAAVDGDARAGAPPGVTCQSSPRVSRASPRAASAAPSARCRATQRAAYDAWAVGQCGEHQLAVGQRLGAGQRDPGPPPVARAYGAGHGLGRKVGRGRHRRQRIEQRGRRLGVARAQARPRSAPSLASSASRRTSLFAGAGRASRPGRPSVSTPAITGPPMTRGS